MQLGIAGTAGVISEHLVVIVSYSLFRIVLFSFSLAKTTLLRKVPSLGQRLFLK